MAELFGIGFVGGFNVAIAAEVVGEVVLGFDIARDRAQHHIAKVISNVQRTNGLFGGANRVVTKTARAIDLWRVEHVVTKLRDQVIRGELTICGDIGGLRWDQLPTIVQRIGVRDGQRDIQIFDAGVTQLATHGPVTLFACRLIFGRMNAVELRPFVGFKRREGACPAVTADRATRTEADAVLVKVTGACAGV